MQTFNIKASQEERRLLAEEVAEWGVVVKEDKSEATLKHSSGAELKFELVDGKDEIKVTVLQNPAQVALDEIKSILEHNIKAILAACKKEAVADTIWLRARSHLHWWRGRANVLDEQDRRS
jgi:hypothetical protein